MARVKRYNSETGKWEYCNTGGMPIKGIDYLTRADYDTMRADMDAYLESKKESVGVSVSGNQGADDVIGASVRIVGSNGSVLEEKSWEGSELVFRVNAGKVYHVEVDASLQGFSSYKSKPFTAVKGGARTVTADVYAEKVNVSVTGIDTGFTVSVKEEYTPVEYIESTGEQYIDTGFKPNQNSKIVLDFHNSGTSSIKCLAGVRVANGDDCFMFWITDSVVYPQFADNGYDKYPVSISTQQRIVYTMDKNVASVGDSSVTMESSTFQSNNSIYLFVCNDNGVADSDFASGRLYSCKIYDNGTLVRDYIPVMNSSGVYGLYDKINGVFYPSATSTGLSGAVAPLQKTFLTLTETSGSCLVPYGTVYSVSATDVDDYIHPGLQTFAASSVSRSVVMGYQVQFLGAAIMDVNGKFYMDAASWQAAGSPAANGIAVSDGTHRFCIAKDIINHVCSTSADADAEYWGSGSTEVSGITTTEELATAETDFSGVVNTDAIVANVTSSDGYFTQTPWSAAGLCRQFTFPNGSKGYLGALGEWSLVQGSLDIINTLMSAIGGAVIVSSNNELVLDDYWSSTQYSNYIAWCWSFYYDSGRSQGKTMEARVRAFCTF